MTTTAKGKHCYPQNRAARQAWLDAQAPAYVPHPEPEVYARDAQPEEIPLGAKRVTKAAEKTGWLVRTTYARGTTLTARGLPWKVVDDLLLRMSRGRPDGGYDHAAACWINGAFDFAYIGTTGALGRRVGAAELSAFVKTPIERDEMEEAA